MDDAEMEPQKIGEVCEDLGIVKDTTPELSLGA